MTAVATDPLGRPIEAAFGIGDEVAVVETAAASGLNLVAAHERDPIAATTYGTGQLLAAAVASGARDIYLAVGGSGTTDGGTGAVRALEAAGGLGARKADDPVRRANAVRGRGESVRAPEGRGS